MPFPTTPIIDNTTRANENPLGTHGGVWGTRTNIQLLSNALRAIANTDWWAITASNTTSADCEFYLTVSANPTAPSGLLRLILRLDEGTNNFYYLQFYNYAGSNIFGNCFIARYRNGIDEVLSSVLTNVPIAPGNQIGFGVAGTTLTAYVNGTTLVSATDTGTAITAAGKLQFLGTDATGAFSAVGGGPLVTTPPPDTRRYRSHWMMVGSDAPIPPPTPLPRLVQEAVSLSEAALAHVVNPSGNTITANSLTAAEVQRVMNLAVAGDTVVLPAGTGHWTTAVGWTAPANVTLKGAGSLTTTGGGDATIIYDDYGGSAPLLGIVTNVSGIFRMAGLTFRGGSAGSGTKYDGIVNIAGRCSQIRVDHCRVDTTTYSPALNSAGLEFMGATYGVVDHCVFDHGAGRVNNSIRLFNQSQMNSDALGVGDQAWATACPLGSSQFIFAEDNVFNGGCSNDCASGGSFVWRHNTFNMTTPAPSVQTHPTGAGSRLRGGRAWEIYANTFTAMPNNYIETGIWLSAGTGVIWGNTIPSSGAGGGTGYKNFIASHEMRYDNSTYTQSAPPSGWGYAGTHQTGAASNWDQNTDATGYAAIDQVGRGHGALLTGDFPNVINSTTGTVAWPNQVLAPVYEWANAYSPVPSNPSTLWGQAEPGLILANRDYYLGTTNAGTPISFTGTSGVGAGLLAARPTTCTPRVGYWATDTQTLYVATATNTWTAFYTPYAYPHPLTL
jgi:hypothetical protein